MTIMLELLLACLVTTSLLSRGRALFGCGAVCLAGFGAGDFSLEHSRRKSSSGKPRRQPSSLIVTAFPERRLSQERVPF